MRIAVDASFLGAQRGGDETFLLGLLEGLALSRGSDDRFPLLVPHGLRPDGVPDDPGFPLVPLRRAPGPAHFAVTMPAAVRRLGPLDLVVSVTHTPLWGRTPRVLVLGDLSFVHRPQDYPPGTVRRLRTLVPRHLASARGVLVPSEFTRQDVLATFGLPPDRVHVVPNRVAPVPLPAREGGFADAAGAALRLRGARPPFLLYLGNLHPRKNVPRLITAFRRARRADPTLREHRLVVAGGRWFGGRAEQDAAAGDPAVVFLGRVTDAERAALMAGAEALAYVSLFEGFGLPPLEAMAHGRPVLASAVTSIPEVCGDAALLVDPTDEEALADGVRRVLTDEALRDRLRRAGPLRAADFGAERVGTAAMTAFRSLTGAGQDRTEARAQETAR